ncbi:hypothetical protein DYB34_002283 [Aphanomyces astaci]|uniref:JmjC domain-containing protein n=1 Tax=Aphanomyces astaci TaxID=112090 RepID=A0A418BF17_APHAT|nr:hypothetical protein DYB34_002283 [Aphanomyces astaci]
MHDATCALDIDPPSKVHILPGMSTADTAAWYATVIKLGTSHDDFRLFLRNAIFPTVAIRCAAPEVITSAMVQGNGYRDPIFVHGKLPGMLIPDGRINPKDVPSLVGMFIKNNPFSAANISQYVASGDIAVKVAVANATTLQPCNGDDLELHCRGDRFRRSLVEFPIADTPLERQFKAPPMVRDLDWFHQLNPTGPLNPNTFVTVRGPASFRDFRMNPWGTSAWLTLGDGLPLTVYLIPPSPVNLSHFAANEKHHVARFTLLFMGNGMHGCHRVDMAAPHDTLFIPPGWLWASHVPEQAAAASTCVVYSGYFFHGFTLQSQFQLLQFHSMLVSNTSIVHSVLMDMSDDGGSGVGYTTDWPIVSTMAEFKSPQPATGTLRQVLKYWIWPAMHMYSRRLKKQRSMSPWENLGLFLAMPHIRAMTGDESSMSQPHDDELPCGWFTGHTADNIQPILDAVASHLKLKQEATPQLAQVPMNHVAASAPNTEKRPPFDPPRMSLKSATEFLHSLTTDTPSATSSSASSSSSQLSSGAAPRPSADRRRGVPKHSFLTPPPPPPTTAATPSIPKRRCSKCKASAPCTCKLDDSDDSDEALWDEDAAVLAKGNTKPTRDLPPSAAKKPAKASKATTTPKNQRPRDRTFSPPLSKAPPDDFDTWLTSPPVALPPKPKKTTSIPPPAKESQTKQPSIHDDDFDLWETSPPVALPPKPNTAKPSKPSKAIAKPTPTRSPRVAKTPVKTSIKPPMKLVELSDSDDDEVDWFATTEPQAIPLPTRTQRKAAKPSNHVATSRPPSGSSSSKKCSACPPAYQRCASCTYCIKTHCVCATKCGCGDGVPKCPVCQHCFATHCTCGPTSQSPAPPPLTLLARRKNELRFVQAVQESTLQLVGRTAQDLHDDLHAQDFDTHEYAMPMWMQDLT